VSCPPQPLTVPSPRPAGERVAIPQSRESWVRGPTKAVIVRSYAGHDAGLSPMIFELKSLAAMSIQRSVSRFGAHPIAPARPPEAVGASPIARGGKRCGQRQAWPRAVSFGHRRGESGQTSQSHGLRPTFAWRLDQSEMRPRFPPKPARSAEHLLGASSRPGIWARYVWDFG